MVKFLSKSFLLDALICLQFLGNSSSAPCSDNSWIRLPATSVSQPQSVADASNATDCQNQCLGNGSCVGVAWNSSNSRCYFNLDPSNIGISYVNQSAAITYYGLIRNYSSCDKDNYNCSWVGDRDNHGFQGSQVDRYDLVGCVQACQDNASCAAVDWNYQESSCWIFSGNPYTGSLPGIFHFTRNCTGTPRSPETTKVRAYTPRISTIGPSTTTSTSVSTSAPVATSSPAGPNSVASSSVSASTMSSSSVSASTMSSSSVSASTMASSSVSASTMSSSSFSSVASSLGAPSSASGTTTASLASTSTRTSATNTSTVTPGAATISTSSTPAPDIPVLALQVSQASNDWYPLAIKPAYIVLAGVGGGCLLLVITAIVLLCEYPLNGSVYASNGSVGASSSKHVHAFQSQSPETNYSSSESREENVDMDEMEAELDKRPHEDAED